MRSLRTRVSPTCIGTEECDRRTWSNAPNSLASFDEASNVEAVRGLADAERVSIEDEVAVITFGARSETDDPYGQLISTGGRVFPRSHPLCRWVAHRFLGSSKSTPRPGRAGHRPAVRGSTASWWMAQTLVSEEFTSLFTESRAHSVSADVMAMMRDESVEPQIRQANGRMLHLRMFREAGTELLELPRPEYGSDGDHEPRVRP